MEIKKSVCPYDCPDCCGLLVQVENGRAVRVEGDPAHAFTRGTLCPKMTRYERTVHSPRRLLTPLRRKGPKGRGDFEPFGWDEAVREITGRWKEIIRADGAEAILPYSYAGTMGIVQYGAGHAFFHLLGASSLDRTICAPAKSRGYRDVMGATLPTAPQEAQKSDLVVLWSISMLATDIHFRHDLEIARRNGAEVWCIDTYETPTARYADRFLRVKPGTDGALALGMLHVLERDGLVDTDFLRRYVQGWEELKAGVLPRYSPEAVSRITEISMGALEAFARAYGRARAPFIRLGSGMSRYTNGSMTARLITCLPAAVGAYAHEGGGLLTSASGSSAFDNGIIRRPGLEKRGIRHINMCELGKALNDPELSPAVKSLYVYSSNPACTAPDQNAVVRGLMRDDLFTVVHERFLTDTARYADIVLPATSSLEHCDIYGAYGHYTVQRADAVIPPVGESRSNWQVFSVLANGMGLQDPMFRQSERDLVERLIESTKTRWPLPVDLNRLAGCEPVDLPLPENYKMNFGTPSGRIEIRNPRAHPELPDYFPPHGDDAPFQMVNAPDPRILDSSFNEREDLIRGNTMVLMMNPLDAARLELAEGQEVVASNVRGEARFTLKVTERTAPGRVVTEGVWWREHTRDGNVNLLTAQRLTDKEGGSTFYDVCVDVRAAE
ncbi:molybdopterin-dependent oxidoreductase [Fretibacterium sp. OH1220_COT-178]|uniref:molybdopterin-dependent oxidoreductase n=1 Tax=Fretibacterium sp. OH1220_COT-178 TaxID=2491047 RepID=UPI000F5D80C4|nr:molybdopterin-dependent oxidoreductase [Fretibacterium sp. OH1220_COT-178]RRD65859.1 molybdopterin oxidoreductase family protein [Fretibacterium sp. OH1220_COT-178]